VNRAVDVALRGEVDHGTRAIVSEQIAHEGGVGDVAAHEAMPLPGLEIVQAVRVAGVSQLIDIHHVTAAAGKPMAHEIRADEAGTARYQYVHRLS
jgi:hypothetical protein